MATSDGYPTGIVVAFICVYILVFLSSLVGNSIVLWLCYKRKRRESSLRWYIANLAIADLAFTVLTILDMISFFWTWIGGQISCKLQSFLAEACYTTSIMTLVLISFERLKAVVDPFSAIVIATERVARNLIGVWVVSTVVASPLLYAYQAQTDNSGTVFCTNMTFGDLGRQIFYSIHAVCFFFLPLLYMLFAQKKIFLSLRSNVFSNTRNAMVSTSSKRHYKVAKVLAALTVAFVICWSPFIVVRTLLYFHLTDGGYIWRASQLLIFVNTALDPILYGVYGDHLKRYARSLFTCRGSPLSQSRVLPFISRKTRGQMGEQTCDNTMELTDK